MKLHVSMKVEDFDSALQFYTQLFNQTPVIKKDDYAKWDVENPAVNFVIEPTESENRVCCDASYEPGVDHLGIQVESSQELDALADRMRNSGQPFLDVEKADCCYATMDKAWVKGAAGEKWEAFLTHSHDNEEYGEDREQLLDSM